MGYYDIILQNNGSKEFFLLKSLENVSNSGLYFQFDDVEFNGPDGEYTYAVVESRDAEYTFKTPLLDTILTIDGVDVILKELDPYTGLMRVGKASPNGLYDDGNNKTYYYEG